MAEWLKNAVMKQDAEAPKVLDVSGGKVLDASRGKPRINVRQKGASGERELIKKLLDASKPVYDGLGLVQPDVARNLMQSREGGADVKGWDWVAIEVKRVEQEWNEAWWRQCVAQAREYGLGDLEQSKQRGSRSRFSRIPLLLHRRNNRPWRARTLAPVVINGQVQVELVLDLSWDQFVTWWQWELYQRLNC